MGMPHPKARSVSFIIPGKAQPKQRPRVMKYGVTFTPRETVNAEAFVRVLALEAMNEEEPMAGPVRLRVSIWRGIPKAFSKKRQSQARRGIILPTSRPDLDNCVKLMDALSGICFKDDSQVVLLEARKLYGEVERTEVEVMEI